MAEVHSDLNSLSKLYLLFLCEASFLPFRSLKLRIVKWATEGVIMFFFEAGKSKTECCRFERKHDFFTNDVKKFRYTLKMFRYHNGHQYHQKHHAKAIHCFLDVAMLLQTNFLVLIAVEAIENDNRQAGLAWDKGKRGDWYKV